MIANPDGSIILTTDIDTSGLKGSTSKLVDSLTKKFGKLQDKISETKTRMQELLDENERIMSAGFVGPDKQVYLGKSAQATYDKNKEEYNKLKESLGELQTQADKTGEALKNATANVAPSTADMSESVKKATAGFEKMGKRIGGLIKRVFIFSVITKMLRALRTQITDFIKQDEKLGKSLNTVKTNLQIMGGALMESLRPALQWLLDKLAYLTNVLAQVLSSWLGKTTNQIKKLGAETKKATKSLAAFDEINTLNAGDENSLDQFGTMQFKQKTDDELAMIGTVVGLALVGLGLLLALTGINIPLGLGMIVSGAVVAYKSAKANWSSLEPKTKEAIQSLFNFAGITLVILGLILCLTGLDIPRGLFLIGLGSASLWASYKLDPAKFKEWFTNFGSEISKIWKKVTGKNGDYWKDMFTAFGEAMDDFVKNDWNNFGIDLVNILISVVNLLLDKITPALMFPFLTLFKLIGWLANLIPGVNIDDSKDWYNQSITDLFGVKIKPITKLAKGGIVPYSTLAMVGERGKEAVLPLENNTEWMDILAAKIASQNGGGGNIEVPVYIDGREVARAVRSGNNKLGSQTVFGGFANAY